ncbi:MAG: hypothetical protein RJQ14_16420, partial [Marinoscillum sp.]
EQPAKYTPPQIAYGIDIGMYRHDEKHEIDDSTTLAWARVKTTAKLVSSKENGETVYHIDTTDDYMSGNDMRKLVDQICVDLNSQKRIAIGMEAPMWQPVPESNAGTVFDLFPARFAAEDREINKQNRRWYKFGGATSSVKAISIGYMLFNDIKDAIKKKSITTFHKTTADIELFEGFVTGDWKLPRKKRCGFNSHSWDAALTALGYHYARNKNQKKRKQALIHKAESSDDTIISHWKTILDQVGLKKHQCDQDCLVVGFAKHDETLRETGS